VWDLRKNAVVYQMKGHSDTVTGLSLSPDGSFVLSNSMDNSLRVWDIRAFAPQERCVKMMVGHQHNFEKVNLIFDYLLFFYKLEQVEIEFKPESAALLLVS